MNDVKLYSLASYDWLRCAVCALGSAGSDDVITRLANQDTASMLSFSSSTNATSSSSTSNNYHSQQQQQLGTKVGLTST